MKKSVLLMALVVAMLTSCTVNWTNVGSFKKLKPSDVIVKNEYKQQPFHKVNVNVLANNVKFVQSQDNDYRVQLSAPENYIDLFEFNVEDHELEVSIAHKAANIEAADVKIVIYSPELTELENSGIAKVQVDSLQVAYLKVENSGVGSLHLRGLQLSRISVECSGVGNVELSGEAGQAKYECSGVGHINAEDLKCRRVDGEISGVGGISCHATDSLKADVSGVGNLKYKGDPQAKRFNRSGVGKIKEL